MMVANDKRKEQDQVARVVVVDDDDDYGIDETIATEPETTSDSKE